MMLSRRFQEAFLFAYRLHQNQERKESKVPYIAHLMGVSGLVMEYGGNEDEAIAGLLHDAAEDQGGSAVLVEIQRNFGETVTAIVRGCSDWLDGPRPPWKRRKEAYLIHLKGAKEDVQLVSACDKLYNARTVLSDLRRMGDDVWSRFSGGKAGLMWYFESLTRVFSIRNPVVDELARVVRELKSVAQE
jgi:(p)ppGpp synthase/HD superfamily hydrolase